MGSDLEEETATHSSILAWKIPWTEEPGGLQSMGLQRVGHDLATERTVKTFVIFRILPGNVLSHIYNFIKNVAKVFVTT